MLQLVSEYYTREPVATVDTDEGIVSLTISPIGDPSVSAMLYPADARALAAALLHYADEAERR